MCNQMGTVSFLPGDYIQRRRRLTSVDPEFVLFRVKVERRQIDSTVVDQTEVLLHCCIKTDR